MNPQIKRFYGLLKLNNLQSQKETLIAGISNSRTEKLSDLTVQELKDLNTYLQGEYNKKQQNNTAFKDGEQMRKHIIAMAHEMGWKLQNGKADMERINKWCLQQFCKKKLNDYLGEDLRKLVSIYKEKVYKQFLNAL